jgi:hypothetical protein
MHSAQVTVLSRCQRSAAGLAEHKDQSTLVRSYVCYPNVAPYVAALYETDSQMATQLSPYRILFRPARRPRQSTSPNLTAND